MTNQTEAVSALQTILRMTEFYGICITSDVARVADAALHPDRYTAEDRAAIAETAREVIDRVNPHKEYL